MTAVNFDGCVSLVLQFEGGWSDNPADPGGATMKGVTFATFSAHFPGSTLDDLRNITDAQLQAIYRAGYWRPINGDALPTGLDLEVFDMAVNGGVARAARILQALAGATQDGDIGPDTLAAVAVMGDATVPISLFADARRTYYRSLPTFATFGAGWLRRVAQIESVALSWAGA